MVYVLAETPEGYQVRLKIGYHVGIQEIKKICFERGYTKILSLNKEVFDSPIRYKGKPYCEIKRKY